MCARYTMATPPDVLTEEFEATLVVDRLAPSFNLAPTMDAPIVVQSRDGERRLGLARFGLVPHWAKDVKIGAQLLNARVETAAEKPAFRDAFLRRRCLVVADGFYEWRREGKRRIPHYFRLPDGEAFGMAGLWAVWHDPSGNRLSSFAVVTRRAEGAVATIHDRMPFILPKEAYGTWLDRHPRDAREVRKALAHDRGCELVGMQVSERVNQVRNDDPSLIEPLVGASEA